MTLFPLVVEQLKAQDAATSCFSEAGRFRPTTHRSSRAWAFEKFLRPGAPLAHIVDFVERECGRRRELVG